MWVLAATLGLLCYALRDEAEDFRLEQLREHERHSGEPTLGEEKSFAFLEPEPEDLQDVQNFAAKIAGDSRQGQRIREKIAAEPGTAAALLQRLAGQQRGLADGRDRDLQAYHHLLELHFQDRATANAASLSRGLIWQLAEDIRRIRRLQNMSSEDLHAVPEEEVDNFVHYFRGLAQRERRTGQAFAEGMGQKSRSAVIFSCSYGDGHKSAQSAVEAFLKAADFQVHSVDTTRDPRFEDWMQKELGTTIGDMWYNRMVLRWKMYSIENMMESARSLLFGPLHQPCPSPTCNNPTKDALRSVLLDLRPDIIVSVYHMDLLPILEVAKDLGNLPLIHVATDMDLKMREVFSEGQAPIYPRFKLAMPFPQPSSQQTALPLENERTFLAGYPVRKPFLLPKDPDRILEQRDQLAPRNTKVVLVMTGGGGQDVPWPEQLATEGIGVPLHILVVTGRNDAIRTRLEHALTKSAKSAKSRVQVLHGRDPQVTVEVAREPGSNSTYISAERLAVLMDLADAIITKPGGGTTAEIAYRGLPAVFDATHGLLHWEEFTVHAFEEQGCGERFVWAQQLPKVLRRALQRPRSIRLAEDPASPGNVLDPGPRIVSEADKLLAIPCFNCTIFRTNHI